MLLIRRTFLPPLLTIIPAWITSSPSGKVWWEPVMRVPVRVLLAYVSTVWLTIRNVATIGWTDRTHFPDVSMV